MPLGETVNHHVGGGTPSKNNSTYWDGDIRWASVKDVGKGKYVDDTIDRISEAGLADSSSNLIQPGNLVVVTRMGLGKVSINRVPMAINQDLRALSLSSLTLIDYEYIFFKTHGFQGTGLTVKGIRVEELLSIPLPLPPLAEQHRIIAKVDELMALCDQLEAAQVDRENRRDRLATASLHRLKEPIAASNDGEFREHARFHLDHLSRLTTRPDQIRQLWKSVLNLAVSGQLVEQHPDDESASELLRNIQAEKERMVKEGVLKRQDSSAPNPAARPLLVMPVGWAITTLGEVALKITDGTHKTPTYLDRGVPFISTKDFSGGTLDFSHTRFISPQEHAALYKRCDPRRGDMLIGRIGTLGKAVLVDTDIEFSLFVSVGLIRFPHQFIAPRFLRFLLNSPLIEQEFDRIKIGGATHTNKLNLGDLHTVILPLPPLAEQHRIVAKVDELMALCDQLEAQLTTTQTESRRLLEALLHEALTSAA